MKKLFLIRTMKLKGATFNLYNEISLSDNAQFVYDMESNDGIEWASESFRYAQIVMYGNKNI